MMFDIDIDINENDFKPQKGKGVIYYLYCNVSNKGYIGQAANYVSGNVKWGTIGRWKSHVREAVSGNKDHCRILNQAIRKYGEKSFTVITIEETLHDELDKLESYYIDLFNTLTPGGYNLEKGGRANKELSEETRQILSENRKGKQRSRDTCKNISDGQIGLRRNIKKRKRDEDALLPKYISPRRDKTGIIIAYVVHFPIGVNYIDYITKSFMNKLDVNKALNDAKKYLDELIVKYAYIQDEIVKKREERAKESQKLKLIEKVKKNLPEYIYPYIRNNKIDGYYVEGYPDSDDNPYPKKDFTHLVSNRKNLKAAKRYIASLEVLNSNAKFKESNVLVDIESKNPVFKKTNYTKNLPKYLAYVIVNEEIIGYQINNFRMTKHDKRKKKYCSKKVTMEEKYNLAINHLRELYIEKNNMEKNKNMINNCSNNQTIDNIVDSNDL